MGALIILRKRLPLSLTLAVRKNEFVCESLKVSHLRDGKTSSQAAFLGVQEFAVRKVYTGVFAVAEFAWGVLPSFWSQLAVQRA
jgi:hypothetical protein